MKALSVRQPYAFAIVHGFKPVENRDWKPNANNLRRAFNDGKAADVR